MLELHESVLQALNRQDYLNLVVMDCDVKIISATGSILIRNSKDLAVELRQTLQDLDDRTVYMTNSVGEPEDEEAEEDVTAIENPNPLHRQKGFNKWLDLVTEQSEATGTAKERILDSYPTEEVEDAVVVLT